MTPTVCCIIPIFNGEKFLEECIESVFEQTYPGIEIICVNDGSTDRSEEILKNYLPRIRILTHQDNRNHGQAAAWNLGLKHTKAELIAFLDCDDKWYPNKIEEQARIFEEDSEVGLVYTNGHAIDENGKILYQLLPEGFKEENIPGEILLNCYIRAPSSTMVRRQILQRAGLFREDLQSTDHDMWVRVGEVSRFHYLPMCLMGYRMHRGQQSQKRKQWEDGFLILEEACKRFPYGFGIKRRRLAVLHYRLAGHDLRGGRYFRSMGRYLLAGVHDPMRALGVMKDILGNKIGYFARQGVRK
jgi:glycosyltransferase involved in cell wall biosynthesis